MRREGNWPPPPACWERHPQPSSTKTHPLRHFAADFEVCQVLEGSRPWCILHSPNEAGSSAAAEHGSLFAW